MLSREMFKQIWLTAINDTEAFNLLKPYFKEKCDCHTSASITDLADIIQGKRCKRCQPEQRHIVSEVSVFRTVAGDMLPSIATRVYKRHNTWWVDRRQS